MATTTPNLGLTKPAAVDAVLVGQLNGNADKLDAAIGRLALLSTEKKSSLVDAINEAAVTAGNAERDAQSANTRAEALAGALNDANVNVRMIDQGSSEMNIIVGVENDNFETAIKAIYNAFIK